MISDLVGALVLEMLRFNLGGQFMWLILIVFCAFCLRLLWRGPADAWVQSAPSTLLSLGVLGTFAGIVLGLSGLSAANVDQRIAEVLAGMSTAFYSSLLAMTLSLLFKAVQVRSVQKLRESDSAEAADDIAEKLLIETANSTKQLRQLNVNAREHSEYLIHITNAVADGSDPQGLLGQLGTQRQHIEQGVLTMIGELSQLREQGAANTEAAQAVQRLMQAQLEARQLSERELKARLDGLQQLLMTLPNRRDFRVLASVLSDKQSDTNTPPSRARPCL